MVRVDDPELERVRRLIVDRLADHEARILLFGSFARGDAHAFSDIDVAVDPARPLPTGTLARLREELEESSIHRHVQIVDLSRVDAAFRRRVLAEGIRWNVSENG